jgi:hypothetical protein
LADLAELLLEVPDLVPEAGGVLEPELRGGLTHLLLQRPDQPGQLVLGQLGQIASGRVTPTRSAVSSWSGCLAVGPDLGQDVGDGLANGLGVDPVLGVVGLLHRPASLGLRDRPSHGIGDRVGVHDDLALDVAGRPAHGLDERRLAAQEPLLVGVEDGDQGDLGQVQALAQEVDADQHVELAQTKIPEELDALDGVDVGMQVADPQTHLEQVLGQVLGHLLGERGDQDPFTPGGRLVDLLDEVVDLPLGRLDHDLGVDQAGRADDLLDDVGRLGDLVGRGCGGHEDALVDALVQLVEAQRPVVDGRGQAEAVLHQDVLAGAVPLVLPVELRHGDMALV